MHEEILNSKTRSIFQALAHQPFIAPFYLAGGTALALQLGHRKSIDLDWFSRSSFDISLLQKSLPAVGSLEILDKDKGTLHAVLGGVKVSFLRYPYSLIDPLVLYKRKLHLAGIRDIACMKVDAISSRGSKKDFIDLFFILRQYELHDLLKYFDKKYRGIKYNHLHILKSLTYFKDADNEPMPVMLKNVSWAEVKGQISSIVKLYIKTL